MSDPAENKLKLFFGPIGTGTHASLIKVQLSQYLPHMKDYPEIVEKHIHAFLPYFLIAPENNREPALESLLIIAKEIPQVRERIIEKFGDIFYKFYPYWQGSRYFNELMSVLKIPVSDKDKHLRELARSVVTLHQPLIIIMGAGFSYDSMPVTTELQPFLLKLLREVKISSPMEMIRENDRQVWQIAKDNSDLFKKMFSGWCANTKPAPQHKIVAKMLQVGQISHIVSFNWDNLKKELIWVSSGRTFQRLSMRALYQNGRASGSCMGM